MGWAALGAPGPAGGDRPLRPASTFSFMSTVGVAGFGSSPGERAVPHLWSHVGGECLAPAGRGELLALTAAESA